jgi:thiol-disulfide isomerase/thioredoxin
LGWTKLGEGDAPVAEAAFRAQIAIYPGNFEPYVSLAFVEASRGQQKAAIANLHAAVVRGFTDLARLQRAEGWGRMRNNMSFYELEVFVPSLEEAGGAWAGWDAFKVAPEHAPAALAPVVSQREELLATVDRIAPVLGPHLTPLWKKTIDRATAARIEAYLAKQPDAPDLERAEAVLMTLYTGGPNCRWEVIPSDAAARVESSANGLLGKFPQSSLRSSALFCRALARNARRDDRGALAPATGDQILGDLDLALSLTPAAPFASSAAAGLITTEAALGRMDRASARFAELRARYATAPATWDDARGQLGELALRAGGLPEFQGTTLDGVAVARRTLEGQVAVIDFWATWCRPCIKEFPTLKRLAERYGESIVLLGVNLDRQDELSADGLRAWVTREKVPGRHVQDGRGWDSDLVKIFGVTEIPFTLVVGADGSVVAVNARGKELERAVAAAVDRVTLSAGIDVSTKR